MAVAMAVVELVVGGNDMAGRTFTAAAAVRDV